LKPQAATPNRLKPVARPPAGAVPAVETAGCYYNTRGGTIIVGVDDQRQPVGVGRPQSVEIGIVNIIRDRLDLDVLPAIEIVSYQEREFVVVTCPRGRYPPYFVRGEPRPYVRVGSTNRPATHAEIRQLYLFSGETSYETLPCRSAAVTDLFPRLIARYRDRRSRHTAGALDLSDEELLRNLGCTVEEEGRLVPTNAGGSVPLSVEIMSRACEAVYDLGGRLGQLLGRAWRGRRRRSGRRWRRGSGG
jgi:predicted HTH transcriptional regulator